MKIILKVLIVCILVVLVGFAAFFTMNLRERHPDYHLDVINVHNEPVSAIQAGFAKTIITPTIVDTWIDTNNNARYEPDAGDSFIDQNGNGRFDAFWLAGFHQGRPATGVHDDIWARAVVFDDGHTSVGIVSVDAIGLFYDDVITIREMAARRNVPLDHIVVTATHSHEVPDVMGMWGASVLKRGVNEDYLVFVREQTVQALADAYEARRPSHLSFSRIDSTSSEVVSDGRPPYVFDDAIHMIKAEDRETGALLGLFLNWGNHPETLGSDNLQVTADFAHYWLDGLENGIRYDDEIKREGIGGTVVWAQGAIGGLMTPLDCVVYDPWIDDSLEENTFEKARAQGYLLADLVLDQMDDGAWTVSETAPLGYGARTFFVETENFIFKIAGAIGIFDRGFRRFKYLRSEINVLTLGPAWMLTIPGEIYPEIVNGGIEAPDGRDFDIDPVEVPPLREILSGEYKFVIGLANDEIGYILPKSQWDQDAPWTYGDRQHYGEINSVGPSAGPVVYQAAVGLISDMKSQLGY